MIVGLLTINEKQTAQEQHVAPRVLCLFRLNRPHKNYPAAQVYVATRFATWVGNVASIIWFHVEARNRRQRSTEQLRCISRLSGHQVSDDTLYAFVFMTAKMFVGLSRRPSSRAKIQLKRTELYYLSRHVAPFRLR
jgi:hypothetical protein